jgi:hypothetical protein
MVMVAVPQLTPNPFFSYFGFGISKEEGDMEGMFVCALKIREDKIGLRGEGGRLGRLVERWRSLSVLSPGHLGEHQNEGDMGANGPVG